jgi:hypothetical protein
MRVVIYSTLFQRAFERTNSVYTCVEISFAKFRDYLSAIKKNIFYSFLFPIQLNHAILVDTMSMFIFSELSYQTKLFYKSVKRKN